MVAAPKSDQWLATALDWLEGASITLFINGMVVSGDVMGQAAYFREIGAKIGASVEQNDAALEMTSRYFTTIANESEEMLARSQTLMGELLSKMPAAYDRSPEQEEAIEHLLRNYVHLKDVSTILGGGFTVKVDFWRGRLSEVTSWCLGRLVVGQSSPGQA